MTTFCAIIEVYLYYNLLVNDFPRFDLAGSSPVPFRRTGRAAKVSAKEMPMRHSLACLTSVVLFATTAAYADEASVRAFMAEWMAESSGDVDTGETDLALGFYDLDDNGIDEAVVLLSGQYWCGSGGCDALVLRQQGDSYDILMQSSVTRPPIGVLATSHNGLRDLYVHVGGGGLPFGPVAMIFDGRAYPGNPTSEGETLPESFKGKVLIGADE
jgi:hypothetical protein